jgi:hypothetical protein
MRTIHRRSLRKDRKAVSPAISTVIMIAAVMVLIFVAMSYASTILDTRLAENEFSANKQFMATTGLQIDDVAWTVGRTQTITYSSRFGHVKYQPLSLTYSVGFLSGSDWTNFSFTTGMIMYNMPINQHNLGNNYFERVTPRNTASFLQEGPTAPDSHVFVVEQLPMNDGNFIRIVAVPSIRNMTSTISSQSTSTSYYKFFLPTLAISNDNPALSQSVTMVGSDVTKMVHKNVDQVQITVSYPSADAGFDSDFFQFAENSITQTLPPGSVVEFYVGTVIVSIGQT